MEKYFNSLEKEIKQALSENNNSFKTLYIGGGTPTTAGINYYEKILSLIILDKQAEITIETNPGAVSVQYLKELKGLGFNRLSIGAQSFNDEILRTLNRQHNAKDITNTVSAAKDAGFENISIDLIYGLPGQTLADWQNTLDNAIKLDIQHISAYGLKIEENTDFFRNPPKFLPDEDETVEMYLYTIKKLNESGFEHYEISNFAKKSCESQHNLAYWQNAEYFGFGLSAHGYVNGHRYANTADLEQYISNPLEKIEVVKLSEAEKQEEYIFLGLRLRKGIDVSQFNGQYNKIIEKYTRLGLMSFDENILRLTEKGILLSNDILSEFLGN